MGFGLGEVLGVRLDRSVRNRSCPAKVESSLGRCHSSDIQAPDVRSLLGAVPIISWCNASGCRHDYQQYRCREGGVYGSALGRTVLTSTVFTNAGFGSAVFRNTVSENTDAGVPQHRTEAIGTDLPMSVRAKAARTVRARLERPSSQREGCHEARRRPGA
jgi:hypothetical protein